MGCIDKKISELVPLVVPAAGDLFAIVDISVPGFETKQITVANFLAALPAAPPDAQYVTLALDATLTNERVLTGTANQVIVTDGGAGGPVTLSTPQDIGLLSSPTFAGLTINGNILVTGTVDGVDVSTLGTTVTNLVAAQYVVMALDATLTNERVLAGTANQITVTDGGAGGNATISLPSDINLTGASSIGTTAGDLTLDPTVNLVIDSGGTCNIEDATIIDITNAEAFLVRLNADAGDVFVVDTVGIDATLYGQFMIDGSADEIQLLVQANAAQTANILTIENSAGADLSGADERGILFSNGNTQVSNVYIGDDAGRLGSTGGDNVGIGLAVMASCTTGNNNVAIGRGALFRLTTGYYNMAIGTEALYFVTTSGGNTAIGRIALNKTTGWNNVAIGLAASEQLLAANYNVAIGVQADNTNQTGQYNTIIGGLAGNGVAGNSHSYDTFLGYRSGFGITTGGNNIFIGYQAGDVVTTGGYNIIIGNDIDPTAANVSDQLNIGALIYGDLTANKRAGVNVTPPGLLATWHVDQSNNAGAVPVACYDQADVDQVLWKIIGTAQAASADRTLVAASDFGTPGALVGWVQINVQDDGARIPNADYWMPFYATPT